MRLPATHNGALAAVRPERAMDSLLQVLSERSHGVIRFEGSAARFDPRAAGAPEVAAFNAALGLIQRFDPTITAAEEMPELQAKLKRLADAMADAFEAAHHTGEIIAPVMNDPQVKLPPERRSAIADFAALATSGPSGLIEAAAAPERREQALKTIAAYESMASAAAAAPRIVAMRDYLDATGLRYHHEAAEDGKLEGLVSQCQLLAGQLSPAVLLGAPHNLDALQARFQQFRWAYVEEYRAAHRRWRDEMRRLAAIKQDGRRHLEALARLNSIKALGPAHGAELEASMAAIDKRMVPCDFDGPLAPEVTPRCPQCGFVLGTPSPGRELEELFEEIRKALSSRLAALSKSAIARLIREHDHSRRLEGFLRITQAAQTEALVRVLDDELARYLAQLIDENLTLGAKEATVAGAEADARPVLRSITGKRPKPGPRPRRAGNPKLE